MNKLQFFENYPNLNIEDFEKSQLNWDELVAIYNDYKDSIDDFNEEADYLFKKVIKFQNVHSCKFRVKKPEHLIEKIIRKNIKGGESINIGNYREKFHDLIGLRAIHLYKEDWEIIHDQIYNKWSKNLIGLPYAYIRAGDSTEFISKFENIEGKGEVKVHQYGYRSIHYILSITRDHKKYYVELQVRTIFEEGWSEIDHDIKYPYNLDNQLYGNYLGILNRLAGASDEMATMLKFIDRDQKDKIQNIAELKEEIKELNEKLKARSIWSRIKTFFQKTLLFFRRK
jgi:putative GTP pyrophosphokinase